MMQSELLFGESRGWVRRWLSSTPRARGPQMLKFSKALLHIFYHVKHKLSVCYSSGPHLPQNPRQSIHSS